MGLIARRRPNRIPLKSLAAGMSNPSTVDTVKGIVAIPCTVQGRWSSFWDCVERLEKPEGVIVRTARGCSPAANRNRLIAEAQKLGAEWIYFLDDDLTFHSDTLKRLLKHFDNPEIEAVVALSFRRQAPFYAIWFDEAEPQIDRMLKTLPPPGQLTPLKAATFGGMLVRMSAIAKMTRPYVTIGQIQPEEWNDDLYFCRNMAAAGVQLWGDSSVRFGHTTDVDRKSVV